MPDMHNEVKERTLQKEKITVSSVIHLSLALKRRGTALEVVGLMSYEEHDLLRRRVFRGVVTDSLAAG